MEEDELDRDLLHRLPGGDHTAFERLYDRHSAHAYGLALRITNDQSLAEDVIREAFLNLFRSAGSLDPKRASVGTWLLAMTRNSAVELVRKQRDPALTLEVPGPSAMLSPRFGQSVVPTHGPNLLGAPSVHAALQSVTDIQRTALQLAYFDGLTQAEIAAQMGIPLGTVRGRVRSGLARLGAILEISSSPDSGSAKKAGATIP